MQIEIKQEFDNGRRKVRMEVKFEINRKDYWSFSKVVFLHVPVLRYTLLGFTLLITYLMLFPMIKNPKLAIGYFVIDFIFIFLLYHLLKLVIILIPSRRAGVLGKHIISISAEGLRETTSVNDSIHKWSGIIRIKSNKKYIYIYTDNAAAHIIPKRAFPTEAEAEQFLANLKLFWKLAKDAKWNETNLSLLKLKLILFWRDIFILLKLLNEIAGGGKAYLHRNLGDI